MCQIIVLAEEVEVWTNFEHDPDPEPRRAPDR